MPTIREIEFDLLHTATQATEESLVENDPVKMRALADQLEQIEQRIKNKFGSLQGRLNGKAFGR